MGNYVMLFLLSLLIGIIVYALFTDDEEFTGKIVGQCVGFTLVVLVSMWCVVIVMIW